MKPSISSPQYKPVLLKPSGKKYYLKNVVTSMVWSEPKGQLAAKVQLTLVNVQHEGKWLSALLDVRDRLFLYADTGSGDVEVFRGFVWDRSYRSSAAKELSIVAYDNLIYFQESEDSVYYPAGRMTSAIFEDICSKWAIKSSYAYESISNAKMPLKGKISDILITDVLGPVKKQTGKDFIIHSEQDAICVDKYGFNKTIYEASAKKNVLGTLTSRTMSGMVTKVVITGKEDDEGRVPVQSTKSKNTDKYGTLQKIIKNSGGTDLGEAETEAQEILEKKADPITTIQISGMVDNPYIRKGHVIKVAAGDLLGNFHILGISHDGVTKIANLDLEAIK